MLHPLLARRHGEDPEVRDAKVRPVKALPPGLPVAEELSPEGGLLKALPHNGHRTAICFEEEVGTLPTLRLAVVVEAEYPIRLDPEAVEFLALAHLDLPAEGQAQPPGLRRCSREYLLRLDERHPFLAAAGDLEGDHDLGDREGVAQEEAGEVAIRRLPGWRAELPLACGGERLGAAPPQAVDEGLGALDVPVELHGRPVQVAMVEEELQAAKGRLRAATQERYEMRGTQEPVAVNGPEDQEIAGRERHARDRGALEARPASW